MLFIAGTFFADITTFQAKLVKNLSSVPEAHQRLSRRPLLPLVTRLWAESPDEATSKLACHILANLSHSDVLGVRNRLFQVRGREKNFDYVCV